MKANILHVGAVCLSLFMGLGIARAEMAWVGIELQRGAHGGVGVRGVVPGAPASMTNP